MGVAAPATLKKNNNHMARKNNNPCNEQELIAEQIRELYLNFRRLTVRGFNTSEILIEERRLVCYLIDNYTNLTHSETAKVLNFDLSFVKQAVSKIAARRQECRYFRDYTNIFGKIINDEIDIEVLVKKSKNKPIVTFDSDNSIVIANLQGEKLYCR